MFFSRSPQWFEMGGKHAATHKLNYAGEYPPCSCQRGFELSLSYCHLHAFVTHLESNHYP